MAIALDVANSAKSSGAVTSLTFSHTCTGANLILLVGVVSNTGSSPVSGITYNGVAMTLVKVEAGGGYGTVSLWSLANPATGVHNIVISCSSATIAGASASYTGAAAVIDGNTSNFANPGSGSSATTVLVSTADNCWEVNVIGDNDSGSPTGSTGVTSRSVQSGGSGQSIGIGDTNGVIHPAGSKSMTWTIANNSNWSAIQVSIAPNTGSASLSPSGSSSPSLSASPSASKSLSPSASTSASASKSLSPSASTSISPSASRSPSSSASASPSQGFSDYSRGFSASLPTNTTDLTTNYTAQEEINVSARDHIYVSQSGTLEYILHQFKNFVGSETYALIEWVGKSDLAPRFSPVYLQIFNFNTNLWETIDSNNDSDEGINFELTAVVPTLTNYKNNQLMCTRVYQLAI